MDDEEWQPPTAAELKVLQAKRERSDRISKIMGDYLLKGYKMLSTTCPKCGTILLQNRDGVNYCISCSELDSDTDKDDPALSDSAARTQAAEQTQREDADDFLTLPQQPMTSLQQSSDSTSNRISNSETASGGATIVSRNELKPTVPSTSADPWNDEDVCYSVSDLPPTGTGLPTIPLQVQGRSKLDSQLSGPYERLHENSNGAGMLSNCSDTKLVLKQKIQWATGELKKSSSLEYDVQLCNLIKASAQAITSLDGASC